ncbi:unnamed protein product [Rotaria sp. Silwood2]|nr:unnamed protein product [Rotaria sp. Silwood2]
MGPFPTTSRQKRFLLVVVDYFTHWVELFPVHTTTSINIAQILINEVFTRYGMPVYVLSDNGPQFISYLFRNFCETLGIQQKFTANYHPQTNLTGRINRTLKPMLAIFAESQPRSWDKEVSKLAFALRTAVNEATGETPAFLMFGRDPKIPLDLIVGEPTEGPPTTTIESIQINEYRNNLIHNLRCTYDLISEHFPQVFPYYDPLLNSKSRGLSELVRLCFGKPLDKSMQTSDWRKRPLKQAQLIYSVLDARVLVDIALLIENRTHSLQIPWSWSHFKGYIWTNKAFKKRVGMSQKLENS